MFRACTWIEADLGTRLLRIARVRVVTTRGTTPPYPPTGGRLAHLWINPTRPRLIRLKSAPKIGVRPATALRRSVSAALRMGMHMGLWCGAGLVRRLVQQRQARKFTTTAEPFDRLGLQPFIWPSVWAYVWAYALAAQKCLKDGAPHRGRVLLRHPAT